MLSVIVPVWNAQKSLSRCLDSLLRQKVDEYEIVCVNDGSTDGSDTILKAYQAKHPDLIRVVQQKKLGLPAARNAGLNVAKGDVIAFCDSDDYLIPGAYGYLLNAFWNQQVDMLHFESVTLDRYMLREWKENDDVRGTCFYEGEGTECLMGQRPKLSFVWSFLYRRSFLEKNRLRFRPVRQCEDVLFNWEAFLCRPWVKLVSSNVYRYCVSTGQLTRLRTPNVMREAVDGYLQLFRLMKRTVAERPEWETVLRYYRAYEAVPCMSRVLSAGLSKEEFLDTRVLLQELDVLPMVGGGGFSRTVNACMASYFHYTVASWLYRRLFLPFVLPQLRRN